MDYIVQEIELILQIMKSQQEFFTRRLKDSPPGGLIRVIKKKQTVYMHSVPDGRYSNGVSRYKKTTLTEKSDLLRQLAQKEYLRVALSLLNRNIRCLEQARAGLLPLRFESIRSRMRKPYQKLHNEVLSLEFLDDSTLLPQHKWAAEPFRQSTYNPQEKTHFTSRGLAMRSRAELLIAELLYRYDIPFRYEQVISIGKYELAPDFTFLDANGEEFYWEYCGMMAVPKYRDHQLWRRRMYESVGINEWTNMIFTYDAADSVDMREIEAVVRTKILPRMQGAMNAI